MNFSLVTFFTMNNGAFDELQCKLSQIEKINFNYKNTILLPSPQEGTLNGPPITGKTTFDKNIDLK